MPRSEILARGPVAGAIGVTVMALAEKLGQAFAKQPSSYVPAHILERLLGLSHRADHERLLLNWAMHVCLPLLDNGRMEPVRRTRLRERG
ncbi:hypothetical protein JH26_10105 [Microvirga sp. BSC39]|nr:hypothetical protein JH26_10105 [Microvirga sp. BSC39]